MVATQGMGNHVTISIAGSQGQLELNVHKPVIIRNVLESIRLLADATISFTNHCVLGLKADRTHIGEHVERSLMLVTALTPHIGYDAAARIAKTAHQRGLSLREAALELGLVSAEQFDDWVDPARMIGDTE